MSESDHTTRAIDPSARLRRAGELYRAGRRDEALRSLRELVAELPELARAWFLLGFLEGERGDFARATTALERAVTLAPEDPEARRLLAKAYTRCAQLDEAATCYGELLRLAPGDARARTELGVLRLARGEVDAAIAEHRLAAQADPQLAGAYENLATALRAARRTDEAISAARRALALDARREKSHLILASVLKEAGRFEEAAAACREGIAVAPRSAGLHAGLGAALALAERSEESIASLSRALELDPANTGALGRLIREKAQACDWTGLDDLTAHARRLLESGRSTIHPFVWLSIADDPALQRRAADLWAAQFARDAAAVLPPRRPERRARIRVGYLSADFHEHATAYLLAELIELHDRGAFEVVAYSCGPDDGGAMRRRLVKGFDRFVDVSATSDAEAARRIRDDEIDILVDLKGYTHGARTGIVALRPAPLIVNYLGYPGTLGGSLADYTIGDATVTPRQDAPHYAEKLVLLPHAYQPNDRRRAIGRATGRAAHGLAEDALVLCCFNHNYKLGPMLLDTWCEALAATSDAVLWLLESRPLATVNLQREIGARGIDPARLIMAPRLPLAPHLARLRCADLFLDTHPYCAHTTASDALWAGVPVLTMAGRTFASRVAASLLHAVGLCELVTDSPAGYRALLCELAADRGRLMALRARLTANRDEVPLFDSPGYTRDLERAFRKMWDRRLAALPPDHLPTG